MLTYKKQELLKYALRTYMILDIYILIGLVQLNVKKEFLLSHLTVS